MRLPRPAIIDFETEGIEGRPKYPPIPVGVAIKLPGKKSRYYAWGHPTENNCTKGQGRAALVEAYKASPDGILFQNAKFDVDVADVHMGLRIPSWEKIHDTLYLLFLDDPHQRELGLKPSAERLLNWPPEERDAVADWLLTNQPLAGRGIKITAGKGGEHYWARYICLAPGGIVGKYACGDVDRTGGVFDLLWKRMQERSMLNSYDRERRLMPIMLESERQGVPVDERRLRRDVDSYTLVRERISEWVIKELRGGPSLNLDSGVQLVDALIRAKKADPKKLDLTPTGKFKSDKASLDAAVSDPRLKAALKYRTQLGTCLGTFMVPWLKTAEASKGFIFTNWNQTKGDGGGTRTGRLSSTPNFQNIPNPMITLFYELVKDIKERRGLPRAPWKDLPPIPLVRGYITPWDKRSVLIDRDYSQQELRALGHFEDSVLRERYEADPWLDVHDTARELISKMTGRQWARKPIKNTGFGLIYGMGIGLLAESAGLTVPEAKLLKDAYLAIFPGLKKMYSEMKMRAANNQPIRTWGGREYYCEPPAIIKGRIMTFDYKMLNVLIQGSCADMTKEALIRHHEEKHEDTRVLINVHDELLASTPKKLMKQEMQTLKECMESVECDVPMLSEGTWSDENWAALETYDKKGEVLYGRRAA